MRELEVYGSMAIPTGIPDPTRTRGYGSGTGMTSTGTGIPGFTHKEHDFSRFWSYVECFLVVYRLTVTGRAVHRDSLPAVRCDRQTALKSVYTFLLLLDRTSNCDTC